MRYTVGCVPYLNARPLVFGLDDLEVDVVYDVPSRLPALLDSGDVQAILVSSIEALSRPDCRVAGEVSISSFNDVQSVRLFSRVPFDQIQSLALDQSSMTSNALAQIILAERFGVLPTCSKEAPDVDQMLEGNDAAVLIGDNGMRASAEGLHVLDLGGEWLALTDLPFVWAVWVGNADLPPDLANKLLTSRQHGMDRIDEVVEREVASGRWDALTCRHYLTEVINYELSAQHLQGLAEFARLLVQHDLRPLARAPRVISPAMA